MPRPRRPDRIRRSSTINIPRSLLALLLGEISREEAFAADPEPASIVSPTPRNDGLWDGFDNFMIEDRLSTFLADKPDLLAELLEIYDATHPGERPPWH